MGIFSNLFRGEMLEKTLHYYFLTPLRREVAGGRQIPRRPDRRRCVLWVGSVALAFLLIGRHFGPAWSDYIWHGPGLSQLGSYVLVDGAGVHRLRRRLPDVRPVLQEPDDPRRGGVGLGKPQPVPALAC